MEYVIVKFKDSRTVFIDDNQSGETNKILMVQEGTHTFDLGEPVNYSPAEIIVKVTGTTAGRPMEVKFR